MKQGVQLDKVVCCASGFWSRCANTVEVPQVQFLDQVYMPVVCNDRCREFLDQVYMPVVCNDRCREFLDKVYMPVVCNDRCWGDSAGAVFDQG